MYLNELNEHWRVGLKFQLIMDRCSDEDGSEPHLYAVGYLIILLVCTLFIDKSSNMILPKFATIMLEDPAALAYLHWKLGEASREECRQLFRCLTLLETGIYEYFPCFRPP